MLGQPTPDVDKKVFGTWKERKARILLPESIESGRNFVCKCKGSVPCCAKFQKSDFYQIRSDILDWGGGDGSNGPEIEMQWREGIIVSLLQNTKPGDKYRIFHKGIDMCKSSWCVMAGGHANIRTFNKHLERVTGKAKVTLGQTIQPLSAQERRLLQSELRDDSHMAALMKHWCTEYLMELADHHPVTGKLQVDHTTGTLTHLLYYFLHFF